jgi:hypothetical protein
VHLGRALNAAGPVTLQPQYSLLAREIEWEIAPAAMDTGLGLLPRSPLGGGWLPGKYGRDQRPAGATRLGDDPNRGMEAYDRRGTGRTWAVIEAVQKIAAGRGVSMAEVALAWVTARPAVSSTIIGARTLDRLEANLRPARLHLTAAETATLDAASDPHPNRLSLWRAGRRAARPRPARPLSTATEPTARAADGAGPGAVPPYNAHQLSRSCGPDWMSTSSLIVTTRPGRRLISRDAISGLPVCSLTISRRYERTCPADLANEARLSLASSYPLIFRFG